MKRILALFISVLMLVSMFPVTASAEYDVPDGYYLVGSMSDSDWKPVVKYKLHSVEDSNYPDWLQIYCLETNLPSGVAIKAVRVQDKQIVNWYPSGTGNDYYPSKTGDVTVYLRARGDGAETYKVGTVEHTLYYKKLLRVSAGSVSANDGVYLLGTMNQWQPTQAYRFSRCTDNKYRLRTTLPSSTWDGATNQYKTALWLGGMGETWLPDDNETYTPGPYIFDMEYQYGNNTWKLTREDAKTVTILDGIQHGTVSVNEELFFTDETLTVTATPDENYKLKGNYSVVG